MPLKIRRSGTRRAGGFTLVEALVALLALSIGLLGVAALQMTGLRNNLSAAWRSQATYLAYDIIDRMRANRDHRIDYRVALGAAPAAADPQALRDLNAWRTNVTNTLPQGTSSVRVDGVNNTVVMVEIQWADERDPTAPPLVFRTRTQL